MFEFSEDMFNRILLRTVFISALAWKCFLHVPSIWLQGKSSNREFQLSLSPTVLGRDKPDIVLWHPPSWTDQEQLPGNLLSRCPIHFKSLLLCEGAVCQIIHELVLTDMGHCSWAWVRAAKQSNQVIHKCASESMIRKAFPEELELLELQRVARHHIKPYGSRMGCHSGHMCVEAEHSFVSPSVSCFLVFVFFF